MIKHFLWLLLFGCSVFSLSAAPLVPVTGSVTAPRLNVRSGPGTAYTVVGMLEKDNQVEITAVGREWLEIRAPRNTATWIMARYLKKDRLTAGVILRSGPGISYEKLGSARAGMTVQTQGQVTQGGWVMIRPFYWTRVYVGRPAVKADEEALAKLPPLPRTGPPANPKFTRLEQSFSKPCEIGVTMNGYLYANEEKNSVITHVLYIEKGGELVPAAFVAPLGADLSGFDKKRVTLKGCRGMSAGWDIPVLIVTGASAGK